MDGQRIPAADPFARWFTQAIQEPHPTHGDRYGISPEALIDLCTNPDFDGAVARAHEWGLPAERLYELRSCLAPDTTPADLESTVSYALLDPSLSFADIASLEREVEALVGSPFERPPTWEQLISVCRQFQASLNPDAARSQAALFEGLEDAGENYRAAWLELDSLMAVIDRVRDGDFELVRRLGIQQGIQRERIGWSLDPLVQHMQSTLRAREINPNRIVAIPDRTPRTEEMISVLRSERTREAAATVNFQLEVLTEDRERFHVIVPDAGEAQIIFDGEALTLDEFANQFREPDSLEAFFRAFAERTIENTPSSNLGSCHRELLAERCEAIANALGIDASLVDLIPEGTPDFARPLGLNIGRLRSNLPTYESDPEAHARLVRELVKGDRLAPSDQPTPQLEITQGTERLHAFWYKPQIGAGHLQSVEVDAETGRAAEDATFYFDIAMAASYPCQGLGLADTAAALDTIARDIRSIEGSTAARALLPNEVDFPEPRSIQVGDYTLFCFSNRGDWTICRDAAGGLQLAGWPEGTTLEFDPQGLPIIRTPRETYRIECTADDTYLRLKDESPR